MDGANIHQIANNCRTSVKVIEEFHVAHIKDCLDASAISVNRPKSRRLPVTLRALAKAEARPDERGSLLFFGIMTTPRPDFTLAKRG